MEMDQSKGGAMHDVFVVEIKSVNPRGFTRWWVVSLGVVYVNNVCTILAVLPTHT